MALTDKDKEVYLKGLKRYKDRGVDIFIDGELSDEKDWTKILMVSEDDSYYMGDYIEDARSGKLSEIHFDKIRKGGKIGNATE